MFVAAGSGKLEKELICSFAAGIFCNVRQTDRQTLAKVP